MNRHLINRQLLCGAAALVAVQCATATASAADLPVVKAPVAYVKICSVYGPGFFYYRARRAASK